MRLLGMPGRGDGKGRGDPSGGEAAGRHLLAMDERAAAAVARPRSRAMRTDALSAWLPAGYREALGMEIRAGGSDWAAFSRAGTRYTLGPEGDGWRVD